MKYKTIIPVMLALFSVNVIAQEENSVFKKVKTLTTLVVLQDDTTSEISRNIRYAVKKYWKITKYEFITKTEAESKYKDDMKHSFLGLVGYGGGPVPFGTMQSNFTDTKLSFYCYEKWEKDVKFTSIVKAPIGFHYEFEEPLINKVKKADPFMKDLETTVLVLRYIQNLTVEPEGYPFYKDGYGPVTNKKLHEKTLLITRENLDPKIKSLDEVQAVYPYPVKMVTMEEIKKYMDSKTSDIAYLVAGIKPGKNSPVSMMIIDAEIGMPLADYFGPDTFLTLKMFKGLAKE